MPQGNVCLYLQVSGGHRIPLRKPRAGDTDTEHFAVQLWRTAVTQSSVARLQRTTLQTLQDAVAASTTAVQANETTVRNKGWSSATSCEAVKAPEFVARTKPADVLPAAQHEAEARHVCIWRSLFLRQILEQRAQPNQPGNLIYAVPSPTIDANLLRWLHAQKGVDAADLQLREAEFNQYRSDWQRWQTIAREEIARDAISTLGSGHDELGLQDVTAEMGREYLNYAVPQLPVLDLSRRPPVQDVLGYLGGGMETYTRCVHDGKDELAAKLRAWTEQVERAPKLEQMAKEQLRTQCLNAFADLEKQKQQLATLQQQLSAERQKQASPAQAVAAVSTQTAVLNYASCSVQ